MITITLKSQPPTANQQAYTVRIEAASSDPRMSAAIFVYHTGANLDVEKGVVGDLFEAVASLPQMTELAENPLPSTADKKAVPYFRKSVAEFVCRSESEALDAYNNIMEDVQDLVDNFKASLLLNVNSSVAIS